jgi:hypothetical protein
MRFYCGVNLSIFFFLIVPCAISAQVAPDSVPVGVIKVQRPSMKAVYRVEMSVMYADVEMDRRRITEISPNQIVFSDSVFNSSLPQPFRNDVVEFIMTDSGKTRIDQPAAAFDWEKYLKTIPHQFAWSDSTRADSARFIYSIDKNGNATCKALPWRTGDTASIAFEQKVWPYVAALRQWQPAKRVKKRRNRQPKVKNAACTVILIVYAYDPYAGRLLPIEVDGGK